MDIKKEFYEAYFRPKYKNRDVNKISSIFRKYSQFDRVLDLYKDRDIRTGKQLLQILRKDKDVYKFSSRKPSKTQKAFQTPSSYLNRAFTNFRARGRKGGKGTNNELYEYINNIKEDEFFKLKRVRDYQKSFINPSPPAEGGPSPSDADVEDSDKSPGSDVSQEEEKAPKKPAVPKITILEQELDEPKAPKKEERKYPVETKKSATWETHAPAYNFVGAGTNIWERLTDRPASKAVLAGTKPYGIPINRLDGAALLHDLYYTVAGDKALIINYADNIFNEELTRRGTIQDIVARTGIQVKNFITGGGKETDNKVLLGQMSKIDKIKLKAAEAAYKSYISRIAQRGYRYDKDGNITQSRYRNPSAEKIYDELFKTVFSTFEVLDNKEQLPTGEQLDNLDAVLDEYNNSPFIELTDPEEDIILESGEQLNQAVRIINKIEENDILENLEVEEGDVSLPQEPPELKRQEGEEDVPMVRGRRIIPDIDTSTTETKTQPTTRSGSETVKPATRPIGTQSIEMKPIQIDKEKLSALNKFPQVGTEQLKDKKIVNVQNERLLKDKFIAPGEVDDPDDPPNSLKELSEKEWKLHYTNADLYADKYEELITGNKRFFQHKRNKLIVSFSSSRC